MKRSSKLRLVTVGLLAALLLVTAACGDDDNEPGSSGSGGNSEETATVRSYFPNVTHATAIGVDKGIFEKNLGSNKLGDQHLQGRHRGVRGAGGSAIDATYIGSGPPSTCSRSPTVRPSGWCPVRLRVGLRWW